LQLFRNRYAVESVHQRRQRDRQLHVICQPAQILQCVRHALQKMRFALVKPSKSVSSQRLQNAHVNIRVIVLHEHFAIDGDKVREAIEIVIK